MKVLVIMHCAGEGPGTLGEYFVAQGVETFFARLHAGDSLPDPGRFSAVVSLGGPMNVYEEERYPFLRDEADFLARAVEAGMPVLGICLGAQMIARAGGARVVKSPRPEVGWGRVELTEDGLREPLFSSLEPMLEVLQWHSDMFEVPAGARLLAASGACPHQAFRLRNALALQFHVEIDARMVREWFADRADGADIIGGFEARQPQLRASSRKLYANFLQLITSK